MYQLPLRFIKISQDVAICATRIVAIMSTESFQARRTIKDEKTKGTLINGAGIRKAEAAIFLDNGSVVSSPFKVDRILKMIEKSNIKAIHNKDSYEKRLTVYDVVDEEPNENDNEVDEVAICLETEEVQDNDLDQPTE